MTDKLHYVELVRNWLTQNIEHEKLIDYQTTNVINDYVAYQGTKVNEIDLIEAFNLVRLAYSLGLKDGKKLIKSNKKMKIEIAKTELVNVKYVSFKIMVQVEDFTYSDEDKKTLDTFFGTDIFSTGDEDKFDTVEVMIDVDTKKVLGWDETAGDVSIFAKVCDEGVYEYYDKDANIVLKIDNVYVPDFLQVNENGYGDYLNLTISKNGVIEKFNIDK